jgi:hypothetical protein
MANSNLPVALRLITVHPSGSIVTYTFEGLSPGVCFRTFTKEQRTYRKTRTKTYVFVLAVIGGFHPARSV